MEIYTNILTLSLEVIKVNHISCYQVHSWWSPAVQPIIQMFCSDSSLRESPKWYRGRFRRQRRPKLSQLQPKQCKVALHQNCHLSTNYRQKALITDTDLGSISSNESRKLWPQSSLSTIVLEDISQVKEASRRMIASLFYVEITESLPVRCLPRVVGFRLCCRLMAGCHLQNLMVRLQDESAIVWYGCDQPIDNLMHQPLYNEARLEEMRYGKEYRMDFGVEIQSVNSIIQVRIGNVTWQEYISGCPYKFHRLVGDQESVIKDIAAGGCSDVNRRHVWRDSESRLQKEIDSLELLLRNIWGKNTHSVCRAGYHMFSLRMTLNGVLQQRSLAQGSLFTIYRNGWFKTCSAIRYLTDLVSGLCQAILSSCSL